MEKSGLLARRAEPGASAAPRHVLSLTDSGRADLLRRLRDPSDQDVRDGSRFLVLLACLSLLPDQAEQQAVLRRRLEFLSAPASFFYDGDRPLRAADLEDPYRRGMLRVPGAASRAERQWLREVLGQQTAEGGRKPSPAHDLPPSGAT